MNSTAHFHDQEEELAFIKDTLTKIVETYCFDSFSQTVSFGNFVQNCTEFDTLYQVLQNWRINSCEHLSLFGGGNCLDLALITQRELSRKGIKTELITRALNLNRFSEKQIRYLKVGHVAVLYTSNFNKEQKFLLEPSYRFCEPIIIKPNVKVASLEREFEILEVERDYFIQVEKNLINHHLSRPRKLLFRPIIVSYEMFQKRWIRLRRNLEIVNSLKSQYPKSYIQFVYNKRKFFTNISDIPNEFLPTEINKNQNCLLSEIFQKDDLVGYLNKFYSFYMSIPSSFWVK
jgi:hypothetical protein